MLRNPFWKIAKVLLRYKRLLSLAAFGLIVSTLCFGAGLGLLLPVFKFLLYQEQSLHLLLSEWSKKHLAGPGYPGFVYGLRDWAIDHAPRDPFLGFLLVIATLALLSIVGSCGRYVHEFSTVTVSLQASRVWRGRVFRRLIHAPMEVVLQRGNSDHISRVIVDTNQITSGFQAILGKAISELLKGVVALAWAFYMNWWLTLIALTGAPLIAYLLRRFAKKIRRATRRALKQRGRMVGALSESLGGIAVVKVHSAEGYERRRFARINRELLVEQMTTRQVKALASPVIDTLALLGVMLVASVAAYLIFRSNQPPEELVYVLAMLAVAGASLKPLSSLNNELSEAGAAAERILEAAALPVEPTGTDAPPGAPELPRHRREIAVERVTFNYPGKDQAAVRDVSLRVPFGQTVAIVGGNGAGKTTLLSLLVRLFSPHQGRIFIDGTDIAGVDLRSLRSQIAVVTQQSVLFEGTIADNIAYGRRHESLPHITSAAQAAFADEFIRVLPLGYQTMLGEQGTGLSGGQRQRLCIARAVLRNPAILILDEATSQVDADSEAKINLALRELRHGRTTFIIAHRLSTVIDADLIVVMHEGAILDQGTHAQLLERCEIYRTLTQRQLAGTR